MVQLVKNVPHIMHSRQLDKRAEFYKQAIADEASKFWKLKSVSLHAWNIIELFTAAVFNEIFLFQ